jgi:tRNA1Val (adenine37-N6)-methyltransferase
MKKRNPFQFKHFIIHQENVALPVTTDACIFASYISQKIQNYPQNQTILDLGMGTGVIMFFINQVLPNSKIMGIEKDPCSFETASKNVTENKTKNLSILNNDFFEWGKSTEQLFDVIVSNPPFFENQLESKNPHKRQARHFSQNGFTDFFQLIYSKLSNHGNAWIMLPYIPNNKLEAAAELDENILHWSSFVIKNNLTICSFVTVQAAESKKPHVVFIHLKKMDLNNSYSSHSTNEYAPNIQTNQLIVYQKNRHYTKECFDLLNPFYNFGIFGVENL